MLTPGRVVARRIRSNTRFQYGAWRMAVDWTVALYIVVPALFFAGYQYVSWWRTVPDWLEAVPFALFKSLLFLTSASGTIRYYIEEADQLFITQRPTWYRRIMGLGAAYSLTVHAGGTGLLFLLAWPLLRGYGIGSAEAIGLFLIAFLTKIYLMIGKQRIDMRLPGWTGSLLKLALLPLAGAAFSAMLSAAEWNWWVGWAVAAVLAVPLFWTLPARIRMKEAFFHDIRRERQERMKVAALLLSQAGLSSPKKAKPPRKRPFLFRGSRRLFRGRSRENVLAESMIKAVYRNTSKLTFMVYVCAAYTTAIAVSPSGGYRWAVWLSVNGLYVWMAKSFAKEALMEPFVKLFPWKDGIRHEALWKAGAGISLPVCLWLSVLAGLLEQGGWWVTLMLPCGAAAAWFGSRLFGLWGV